MRRRRPSAAAVRASGSAASRARAELGERMVGIGAQEVQVARHRLPAVLLQLRLAAAPVVGLQAIVGAAEPSLRQPGSGAVVPAPHEVRGGEEEGGPRRLAPPLGIRGELGVQRQSGGLGAGAPLQAERREQRGRRPGGPLRLGGPGLAEGPVGRRPGSPQLMAARLLVEGAGAVGGVLRQGGQTGEGEGGLGVALIAHQALAHPELRLVGVARREGVALAGGALQQDERAVEVAVPLEGEADQHRHPAVLGLGDHARRAARRPGRRSRRRGSPRSGSPAGCGRSRDSRCAGRKLPCRSWISRRCGAGISSARRRRRSWQSPPSASVRSRRRTASGSQGRCRIAGRRGRHQARRHLGVPQPVLVEGQAVVAVELERRGRAEGAGERFGGVREAAQGVEEMAAEVVEAELARGVRTLGELLLDAAEGLALLPGELQLDELGPRVRDGDRGTESEARAKASGASIRERSRRSGSGRVPRRSQAPIGTDHRATLAPSFCNFNSICS